MAKTKKSKKQGASEQGAFAMMTPAHLEWYEDETGGDLPDDDAGTKPAAKPTGPTTEELMQQIANLNGQLSAMQMQQAPTRQTSQVAAPPEIDLNDLPDPMDDPQAYAKALADKTKGYVDAVQRHAQAEAAQSNQTSTQVQDLWRKFSTKHADYADDFDKVEVAAERVAKRAAAGGIDLNRYMFVNSDKFVDDVAAEMETFFGMKAGGEDTETDTVGGPDDDEDDRTVGIFGGAESGGKPAKAAQRQAPQNDMFGDLREWQTKNGFHR